MRRRRKAANLNEDGRAAEGWTFGEFGFLFRASVKGNTLKKNDSELCQFEVSCQKHSKTQGGGVYDRSQRTLVYPDV